MVFSLPSRRAAGYCHVACPGRPVPTFGPVARCASHPPKRGERPVRSWGPGSGYSAAKVRHEPIVAVRASRSAGGRDSAFGVSLAGFGAPAIRRRRWAASPGAGLQAAHPRQSPRRQYLQGQPLRCRRRLPLADHRRSRLSLRPRWRPQWRHQTQLRSEAEYPPRALGASLPPLGVRARDARGSVHDRSFGAVGWPRRHRAGRSRQWLGAVPAARVWAARQSLPRAWASLVSPTMPGKRRPS